MTKATSEYLNQPVRDLEQAKKENSVPLEWKSGRYVGVTAIIGPRLELYVGWGLRNRDEKGPNYTIIVFGNTLKNKVETEEEGKKIAVRVAKKILSDALQKLGEQK